MIHVDDLAEALAQAVERPPAASIYEIDDGQEGGYGYGDMIAAAGAALGCSARRVSIPRPLMEAVAGLNGLAQSLGAPVQMLSRGKVAEIFHPDWVVHDRRLAVGLDFQARFDLPSGFCHTILWYRRNGWL